jgi:hypothetical protein
MQKIFTESNKPFNVFMFFVYLMGTINNQTKEWHMSQDDMAVSWGASKRTINDYLVQLESMQLIYVYRHRKRRADGTYHKKTILMVDMRIKIILSQKHKDM